MSQKLLRLIPRLKNQQVLVVGDVMLDEYVWGKVERISPEAPVPIADVQSITHVPGGAANVAHNVVALGGRAHLAGIIGTDSSGDKLIKRLSDARINVDCLLIEASRPTTLKSRIIAHSQHVVRVDREDKTPLDLAAIRKIIEKIENLNTVNAILISDYGKGIITPSLCQHLIRSARRRGIPIAVDPKGDNYAKYRGTTMITPNLHEAEVAARKSVKTLDDLASVGRTLLKKVRCQYVLITRGKDGMSLFEQSGKALHLPARPVEVYDITGAGDTAIGALTLALAAGASAVDAAMLANFAAGVVVRKVGTATASPEELVEAIRGKYDRHAEKS